MSLAEDIAAELRRLDSQLANPAEWGERLAKAIEERYTLTPKPCGEWHTCRETGNRNGNGNPTYYAMPCARPVGHEGAHVSSDLLRRSS